MRPLIRRLLLPAAALVGVALIIGSAPPRGEAGTAPDLQRHAAELRRSESAALLSLYAAEASLSRARAGLARLEERSAELERAEVDARRETEITRRSLVASQKRVAALLRDLYVRGEPDPLAVILGATSLDEAMVGIEGLARATALNERLGLEAEQRSRRLVTLRAALAARRGQLSQARDAALIGAQQLAASVHGRRATIAALRRQQSLTTSRLSELESVARDAGQRSAVLVAAPAQTATSTSSEASAAPTPVATSDPVAAPTPTGTRTLVVDAVAYHLSGNTASGLPVGVGVVAVDPSVIPLGTRLRVPGYGPAVAADVGSAVKGNVIDLWMPSTAQALAWGRRTVTITIYG